MYDIVPRHGGKNRLHCPENIAANLPGKQFLYIFISVILQFLCLQRTAVQLAAHQYHIPFRIVSRKSRCRTVYSS